MITATANSGAQIQILEATGTGSYTGTKNRTTIAMNAAIAETASLT
jgi:hypothetical protein